MVMCVSRADEKLELRHTLEGHQLGVVSVDINPQGTSILQPQLHRLHLKYFVSAPWMFLVNYHGRWQSARNNHIFMDCKNFSQINFTSKYAI